MKLFLLLAFNYCLFTGIGDPKVNKDQASYKLFAKSDHKNFVISIYKNTGFKNKELDVVYMATCFDTKKNITREFFIKKSDHWLREKTLSNFTMVEVTPNGKKLVYPFGWENLKIGAKDIKDNCVLIIENKIRPI